MCVCVRLLSRIFTLTHMNIPRVIKKTRSYENRGVISGLLIDLGRRPAARPTPHTGSITRPLRITAWHRTRVCPLCTFGSVDFLLPREHGDAGGVEKFRWTFWFVLCSRSEGWWPVFCCSKDLHYFYRPLISSQCSLLSFSDIIFFKADPTETTALFWRHRVSGEEMELTLCHCFSGLRNVMC